MMKLVIFTKTRIRPNLDTSTRNDRRNIHMKKYKIWKANLGLTFLAFSINAFSNQWTDEQNQVLAFQERCQSTQVLEEWMNCFHDDFNGLGIDQGPVPTTKNDRRALDSAHRAAFESELILFKPLSVYVNGDFAIVNYIVQHKQTNKNTAESKITTQRWMDVLFKDDGKWFWISDHGVEGP